MEKNSTNEQNGDQDQQILQKQQDKQHKEDKENQDSPGFLKKPSPPVTSPREYAHLPLADIEHYNGIDDYIELTTSPCPVVLRTPTHYHCIDGYNLVEKAMLEGAETILCHVFNETEEVSESDLALWKTGIRMVSEQGKPYYAEIIRNCKKVLALLEQTVKNPVMNSHGGKRRGNGYAPINEEDDLRVLMAKRFGLAAPTTNKYICYGKYLNEDILKTLVKSKERRGFFRKTAPNKTQLVKKLKSDEKNDLEITAEVSKKMADWLEEYHEKGKITPLFYESTIPPEKKKCLIHPPTLFTHHVEHHNNHLEDTIESLNHKMKTILESLCAAVVEDSADNKEKVVVLKGGVGELATLISKYEVLVSNTTTD